MSSNLYLVNADYSVADSLPLVLVPGQEVETGRMDHTWPGWIWVKDPVADRCGYVPVNALEMGESGKALAKLAFDSAELSVKRGEKVTSLKQEHGWHWCRKETDGSEGWLAGYLLRPIGDKVRG